MRQTHLKKFTVSSPESGPPHSNNSALTYPVISLTLYSNYKETNKNKKKETVATGMRPKLNMPRMFSYTAGRQVHRTLLSFCSEARKRPANASWK